MGEWGLRIEQKPVCRPNGECGVIKSVEKWIHNFNGLIKQINSNLIFENSNWKKSLTHRHNDGLVLEIEWKFVLVFNKKNWIEDSGRGCVV